MLSLKLGGCLFGLSNKTALINRNAVQCFVTMTRPTSNILANVYNSIGSVHPQYNSNNRYNQGGSLLHHQFYSQFKKSSNIQLKAMRGKELIKDALEIRKEQLLEKRDVFVKDMRETRSRVKERVKEKMEEIVERENVMTIPNLLCVGRGLMSPYLAYVVVQEHYTLAMGLLLFAGLTDLVNSTRTALRLYELLYWYFICLSNRWTDTSQEIGHHKPVKWAHFWTRWPTNCWLVP